MATTTFEAIRASFFGAIEARAPSLRSDVPFRRYTGDRRNFADWAAAAGDGSFRVFDLRHGLDRAFIPPHDLIGYLAQHTILLEVGYPDSSLRHGAASDANGEDLLDADLYDLDAAIGQPSSRAGWPAGLHDSMYVGEQLIELGDVRVLRLIFQLTYNRSIPT